MLPGTIRRLERGLLQGETLFDRYRHIVVSTDFIKRPGLREQFWHGCPDLLIIDEAHTCVSDGTGGRSRMLRHELVTGLAKDAARHLILVTATPHSGKEEGFRNLLACWTRTWPPSTSNRSRAGSGSPATSCSAAAATSAPTPARRPPFPEDRLSQERPYPLSPAYKELFDDVLQYARETVRDPDGGQLRQRVRYWSALALLRALASSPRAAAATLAHQGRQRRRRRRRRSRPARPLGGARPPRRGDRRVRRRHPGRGRRDRRRATRRTAGG